jgi:hypothetical protein
MILISKKAAERINAAISQIKTAQAVLQDTISTVAAACDIPDGWQYDTKQGAFVEPPKHKDGGNES